MSAYLIIRQSKFVGLVEREDQPRKWVPYKHDVPFEKWTPRDWEDAYKLIHNLENNQHVKAELVFLRKTRDLPAWAAYFDPDDVYVDTYPNGCPVRMNMERVVTMTWDEFTKEFCYAFW